MRRQTTEERRWIMPDDAVDEEPPGFRPDDAPGRGCGPSAAMAKLRRGRRSPGRRLVKATVGRAEALNRDRSLVGREPVFDNARFPWVVGIEREWRAVRAELDRVLERREELPAFHEVLPDVRTIARDAGWKTFVLVGCGVRSRANIAGCPATWRVVRTVPGLKTAMFSILEPGKHVPAHKGAYNGVLRLHLGLIVPEPRTDAAIRVADRMLRWEGGRAIVFDDVHEHEAWNRTSGVRVVLLGDFVRPLRFPASLVNRLVLGLAPLTPFIREGQERQRSWERRFYRHGQA